MLDTLLIIVVLFSGGPINGHMTRCRPPSHMPLRQDEHYSYLRDRSCRHDFWDRVNYVPLDSSGSRYLTIGGEVREWYEGYHNGNWGSGPQDAQDENGYSLSRATLYRDWHVRGHIRFFRQLTSDIEGGKERGSTAAD